MMGNLKNKEFRDYFSTLIDLIPNSVVILDANGIFVAANKMAGKFTGFDSKELVGQHFSKFFDQEQVLGLGENIEKRLSGVDIPPYEIKITTKEGKLIFLEANGNRVQYQGELLDLIVFHDVTERNKHQEMLKQTLVESEQKFRNLAEQSPNMIFIFQNGKVIYVNEECERSLGYSKEYFYSPEFNFLDLMAPENRELAKDSLRRHMSSVDSSPYFVQEITKDGRRIDVAINAKLIEYEGQQAILGIVTDITKIRQDEQALKEAEARYRALFEEAPLGVLVIDPETMAFIEFNDVAHSQLGYSREEFSKLTIPQIEEKEALEEAEVMMDGVAEFETEHYTKNGEIRNVVVTVKTIELAGKKVLQCLFHDITEIKKIQDDLVKSELRFRKLVELAQEGIWVTDKYYKTTFVNHCMAQILGYNESEIMEKSLFELVDQKDVENLNSFLRENVKIGHFEYEFPRKDGSRVYTSVATSEITDDTGQLIGNFGVISDITERKKMQDQLETYSKGLEELVKQRTMQLAETQAKLLKSERLAAIGELAGMIGHDLRNPLTGIKSAVYYLNRNVDTLAGKEKQTMEMLQTINSCIDHSDKIIRDLLDYSREIQLEKQKTSLKKLLDESLAMLNVPEKIRVLNHLPEELSLRVDCVKVKRVFTNLAKNAFDAMPNGGKLTITSKRDKDNVQVSFADTGIGIPKEILPKLFLPLFTTKAQGMGFGLAICKRIVDAHGGKIDVETSEGNGTTFTVTLPVEPKLELKDDRDLNFVASFYYTLMESKNSS